MSLPLLFLSGAGLPAWIWDDVRAGLPGPSIVATRPAAGAGTVTAYAQTALEEAPDGPFAVVAHSAGGVVAGELVRLAQGRVGAVLGVAAVLPAAGASFTSSFPFPQKAVLPLLLRLAGTRPPESAIRKGLAAGLDEDTVQRLIADLEPEPLKYFTSRTASDVAMRGVPNKQYLLTTNDAELPAKLQRRYAQQLGVTLAAEVASGHLPMLTHPAAVVAAVRSLSTSR